MTIWYKSTDDTLMVREAIKSDTPIIYRFIKALAEYEKMLDHVTTTCEDLEVSLFEKQLARVILSFEDNKPTGFALFFLSYSTFLGKANLFLEDLFVLPEYRGKEHGKLLLNVLAKIAQSNGMARIDWLCLDWNKPSIDFYHRIGAKALDAWKMFRLEGEALSAMAKEEYKPDK